MQHTCIFVIFIAFLALSIESTQAVDISNCGSFFSIGDIKIEGCGDEDTLCNVPSRANVSVSFTINTGKYNIEANLVNHVVLLVGGGVQFNLTAAPEDPCEILVCPLEVDYTATFSGQVYIPISQSIVGTLRWILRITEFWEQLMCFEFPVRVIV